jgi:predicted enzyme related to lactoylglutathione lyase
VPGGIFKMSKIESYQPGSFCWAELATSDAAAAKLFYGEMFGWTAIDMPMPQGVYTLFQADGNDAAAVYTPGPGVPTNWGVYFVAASADESAAMVEPAGGKVVAGPFDAHDAGRMAVVQDPQGAVFSLWQARRSIGATHGGPLGQVVWPELATNDPAGAAEFYTRLFGWRTKPETGVAEAQYTEWVNDAASMGGMLPMQGAQWQGVPPHWSIYITVADCDERAARAVQLGGTICVPPTDIPNVGRFSVVSDPQGAMFNLIQMAAAQLPATA